MLWFFVMEFFRIMGNCLLRDNFFFGIICVFVGGLFFVEFRLKVIGDSYYVCVFRYLREYISFSYFLVYYSKN